MINIPHTHVVHSQTLVYGAPSSACLAGWKPFLALHPKVAASIDQCCYKWNWTLYSQTWNILTKHTHKTYSETWIHTIVFLNSLPFPLISSFSDTSFLSTHTLLLYSLLSFPLSLGFPSTYTLISLCPPLAFPFTSSSHSLQVHQEVFKELDQLSFVFVIFEVFRL